MQALEDADIDMAFITETWLEEHSGNIVGRIKEYNFNIHRTDRGSIYCRGLHAVNAIEICHIYGLFFITIL